MNERLVIDHPYEPTERVKLEWPKALPCNGIGGPREVHAFDMDVGGPCGCGKYASQWDYDRRERDPLPPGSQKSWKRGIWG
jgi:hypothetical protein